jgi:hypothetical protein
MVHRRRENPFEEEEVREITQSEPPPFTDWDNPEDKEDAPEGYYDDDDDSYVPGPDDPDYDLSEQAGYAGWEAPRRDGVFPRWVIVALSILLILAVLTPVLLRIR